jgi:hypothetical protein
MYSTTVPSSFWSTMCACSTLSYNVCGECSATGILAGFLESFSWSEHNRKIRKAFWSEPRSGQSLSALSQHLPS